MLQKIKRLMCHHVYAWSERRQREVCYQCGQSRDPEPQPTLTRSGNDDSNDDSDRAD